MNAVRLSFPCLLAALLAVTVSLAAERPGVLPPTGAPGTSPSLKPPAPPDIIQSFNIQFPGGTPEELVKAIEAASGTHLNAIIPPELADVKLPALRMNDVAVEDLFRALESASRKTVRYTSGNYFGAGGSPMSQYQQKETGFGFRSVGKVWVFYQDKIEMPEEQKICRFYQLEPYLKTLKVEDITTAIQTGWKLQGVANPPALNFHAETKLLISVGDLRQLQVIDDALKALGPPPQSASETFANRMNDVIKHADTTPSAAPAIPSKPAPSAKP